MVARTHARTVSDARGRMRSTVSVWEHVLYARPLPDTIDLCVIASRRQAASGWGLSSRRERARIGENDVLILRPGWQRVGDANSKSMLVILLKRVDSRPQVHIPSQRRG